MSWLNIVIPTRIDDLERLAEEDGGLVSVFNLSSEPTVGKIALSRLVNEDWLSKPYLSEVRTFVICRTDLPHFLLRNGGSSGLVAACKLAETHTARKKLVELGLVESIQRAVEAPPPLRPRSPEEWFWVFHNHVNYVEGANIPRNLVVSMQRDDRSIQALECLTRIVLRGRTDADYLFDPWPERWIGRLADPERDVHRATRRMWNPTLRLKRLVTLSALACRFPDEVSSDPRVDPARHRRMAEDLESGQIESLIRNEKRGRFHLQRTGYLRPGESLLIHLGLLSSSSLLSSSKATRPFHFASALNLFVVLSAVSPAAFDTEPFDSVAARVHSREARKAKRDLDAHLMNVDVRSLPMEYEDEDESNAKKGILTTGHELLAESVLVLAHVEDDEPIRRMGVKCLALLPRKVLDRVVWSPSLHRYFGEDNRGRVLCALMVSLRLSIPSEIWLTKILPFACTVDAMPAGRPAATVKKKDSK